MAGKITGGSVWKEYERGVDFKERIGLFETVKNNENFFIGKQWEGVRANGLPTPVFNFLKRVVLFTVSSLTSTATKVTAAAVGSAPKGCADAVNFELDALFDSNRLNTLIREFLRNAAVEGDGCLYTYWDTERGVRTESVENSRVFFGNVNDRDVQRQPYIIISSREMTERLRARAGNGDIVITPEPDGRGIMPEKLEDGDKATVLLRMWKDAETGTVWCCETVRGGIIRAPWDTGLRLYPIVWLPWDYVRDCYHGQAMITGLIPNQIFINKLFAMSMISLMTMAYPKIVYDRSRVARWDNRVGAAIPVSGGDVNGVAKIIDPAHISPQISRFIDKAISYTQTFLGATPAALGDVRPDNTSAIIALQKASSIPNEIVRHNLYRAIEDLAEIYIDFTRAYYGEKESGGVKFDFSRLDCAELSLKLDVGASAYWSEMASMNTLDNLLIRGKINFEDYLERVPDGYIPGKRELLDKIREPRDLQMTFNV
jgi:hypothetical protein